MEDRESDPDQADPTADQNYLPSSSGIQWNLEMWTPLGPEERVLIREVS